MGVRCLLDNLLEEHGVVRHNSARLAQLLIEEFVERQPPSSESLASRGACFSLRRVTETLHYTTAQA